ncbi:MAG TPA: Smr/MutS family protein [Casimicrobiaceae bacterium]|nr:Smr/MutS family protein [Casimicrobiaceae bacterium]
MAKLEDLKKLVDAARARAPDRHVERSAKPLPALKSTQRVLARTRHADGDIDLAQAFADVERLQPRSRVSNARPRPKPIPAQRIADDADALSASKYGAEPTPNTWEIGQELEAGQTFVRRGLGTDILRKMRRGEWSVQSVIDLHGHTIDEAHDALSDFLDDARAHGYRCVRVIHGKGLTSPNREPVLKGKVRAWLARWDEVLAYCEAPQNGGGSGAVLVLLRGRQLRPR